MARKVVAGKKYDAEWGEGVRGFISLNEMRWSIGGSLKEQTAVR
jgi:hypothetical protein